jgi:hypothetical protein
LATSAAADNHVDVRLAGPHGEVVVVVSLERVAADGLTCANPRPNHFVAYRPVSIRPV